MISSASQLSREATRLRTSIMALFGLMPYQCELEGLPNSSSKNGRMASMTSGSWGVVAL
jgi:hypothetical protein